VVLTAVLAAQPRLPSELRLFPLLQSWDHPLDGLLTAPPAFAGDLLFLPVDGQHIVAWDALTGTPVWTADGAPVSAPAAGDGLLFLAEQRQVVALRQATGAVAWRVPLPEPLAVPLVWDNGWLVAADTLGHVLALRALDGAVIWTVALDVALHAPPALAADRVYVPLSDNRVVSLDVSTGARQWARALGGPPNDIRAFDDRVYVGSNDNYFYCLLAGTGEVAWRWRTGGDVIGVPAADEHSVYFVSRDNVLRRLDRRSGSQRWKRALPGRPNRGPVRAGDLLLVTGLAPKVSAFAMSDGAPAGEIAAPGELASAPFVFTSIGLPRVVIVSRDILKGTRAQSYRRLVDPPMTAPLPVLPGAITIAPPAPPEPAVAPVVGDAPPLAPPASPGGG
jgi:outer membrane protein assembly factor BamB